MAESTTQVAISWNASLRATDYRLYRDGNLVQSAITSTSTVDAPVAPATQYVYYLRACKGDRCSAPSDSVVVNTPGGGSPPPPPKPGGISADSTTETQVGMSWAPVPGATEYHVFRQGIFLASVTQPSYVDTSVAPGTLYFYMVRACASDACSFPSAPTVVKTPSPPLTCSGVSVSPTPDLQAVINSKPTGTTFCLSSGTYPISGAGVLVRANDTLIGQPGTVLDGGGSATTGLYGYGTDTGQNNVTIKGLILRNFASKALRTGWGWTIQGNEISNSQVGVSLGTGSVLRGNYIHDNFQYGVAGGWGNNMLIEGNDIAHNNTSLDCGGTCVADAGGSKIIGASTGTYGLVWRGNWVHDNFGPGIWSDIDVRQVLYENNLVENNTGAGIFQEISWNGTIRYNVARDNATDYVGKSCAYAGQIHVNNAAHVAIYGNTVSAPGGANGICAVDMARTDPSYCPTHLADISVHDNTLEVTARSLSGFVSTRGTAPDQVSFDRDTFYVTDTTGGHWNWNWGRKSWAELHAMSEELQGSLTLVS